MWRAIPVWPYRWDETNRQYQQQLAVEAAAALELERSKASHSGKVGLRGRVVGIRHRWGV